MDTTIVDKYLARWPHSLTRRQIDLDDKKLIALMEQALKENKPLTDAVINLPPDVSY